MHEVRGDHIHVHCTVDLQEFVNLHVVGMLLACCWPNVSEEHEICHADFENNTEESFCCLQQLTTTQVLPLVLPFLFCCGKIDIPCMPACAAHLYSNCRKASSLHCAGAVQTVVIPRCQSREIDGEVFNTCRG